MAARWRRCAFRRQYKRAWTAPAAPSGVWPFGRLLFGLTEGILWYGRLLLSAGKDASVRIWAPEGGSSCVAVYKGHREAVTHMSVVAGRQWVCSCDCDMMHIFDLETQHKLHALRGTLASGHEANLTASLALSPLEASPTGGGMVMAASTAKYPAPVAVKLVDLRSPSRALEWCSSLPLSSLSLSLPAPPPFLSFALPYPPSHSHSLARCSLSCVHPLAISLALSWAGRTRRVGMRQRLQWLTGDVT